MSAFIAYHDIMQKAERLMAITLMLQSRGKLTADRLADVLGVSQRTIYRDIDSLSLAHVPVSMDHGPGGGYFLSEEYRIEPSSFTGDEAVALALGGALAGGARLFGDKEQVRQALLKLEASMPDEFRADVQKARERIILDAARWHRNQSPSPFLERVRRAVWEGRRLMLLYWRGEDARPQWRRVDPLGLVFKAGTWYLVAWCYLRQDYRTFRLSRIQDIEEPDEPINPRPDFDLEAYWESSRQRFEELTAPLPLTLRVAPHVLHQIEEQYTVVRSNPDGSAVISLNLESVDAAVTYALSLGAEAIVLDPPDVRTGVVRAARSVASLYEG